MTVVNEDVADRSANDERLLKVALENLNERGFIEYTGEFGDEVVTFIPFVAWLNREGHLDGRRVISYEGMRPYYFFLKDYQFEAKAQKRLWRPATRRRWPANDTHVATKQRWHVIPDYRAHYAGRGRTFDRPILFIQNKFTVEWKKGPINYLPLGALHKLLRRTVDRFDIVYSRPRPLLPANGYSADHNSFCDYPDVQIVREFENVEILEETCVRTGADYNATKLEILAKAHVFVAAQGGGASLLAYFGNSALLVWHREGLEVSHAYSSGVYKYLSDPPPLLLVARDGEQLIQGMKIVSSAEVKDGSVVIRDDLKPLLATLEM